MDTWRRTAIWMGGWISAFSALPVFSLKSSRKEICREVSQLNAMIMFVQKQVKVAHVQDRSPVPLLDGNRRFGRILCSEAISERGE